MPLAGAPAESIVQRRSQPPERLRQLPVTHGRRVIKPRRLAFQHRHEVQRVDERFVSAVPTSVLGDDPAPMHDGHAVDVRLDRHLRERRGVRHAVTVGLEHRRLVLVHQAGPLDARVEEVGGKRQRVRLVRLEVRANRRRLMRHRAITLIAAELHQLPVQVRQVIRPGHRRTSPPLQREHRTLHVALLLSLGRHAEQRVEPIVRSQGRIGGI